MKSRLVFCVPAHGRFEMTEACLHGLAATCEDLDDYGIAATAFVVADDRNLEVAERLGFGTVRRENRPLGRKFNDGFEAAYRVGADFVVPCGTDDLVCASTIAALLPGPDEVRACTRSAVVNETGTRIAPLRIKYPGGDGVRVIPMALLEPLRFRPADGDKDRAIDTSIHTRIKARTGSDVRFVYHDEHPFQIVDFKTSGVQLNPYEPCLSHLDGEELDRPFEVLADYYRPDVLERVAAVYGVAVPA